MNTFLKWFLLTYIKTLAQISLFIFNPYIIGIAGSAGKSSCRNALYAVLKNHIPVKMIKGNSETGIPLGILGVDVKGYTTKDWLKMLLKAPLGLFHLKGASYLILEMGIDAPYPPKNMEYLLSIAKPKMAISLNVSATHTQQFETLMPKRTMTEKERLEYLITKIAEEDTKIITQSNAHISIYNADDPYLKKALSHFSKRDALLFSFGTDTKNSISYQSYTPTLEGTDFTFTIHHNNAEKKLHLHFAQMLLPQVYQQTFAPVIIAALELGMDLPQIKNELEKNFNLPKGRSSLFNGEKNTVIIDSSYNASKDATNSFLQLVEQLKKKTKRPVVFLFGDMNELGNESKIEHEALLPVIANTADYVYCVGPETKKYIIPSLEKEKHIKEAKWFSDSRALGAYVKNNTIENAIILVKGSQNRVFLEEAVKTLLANKEDIKNVCRQEDYWLKIKENYFKSVS